MAIQLIEIGNKPNDGSGEALRDAFNKVNENFKELFDRIYVNDENFPQGSEPYVGNQNLYLTTSSKKIQTVNMTAKNLTVFLPPATDFLNGGPKFEIRNIGSFDFTIRTNEQGQLVTVLKPAESALLFLTNNSDNDGSWGLSKLNDLDFYEIFDDKTLFYQTDYSNLNSSAETFPISLTPITDTKAIVIYHTQSLDNPPANNFVANVIDIVDGKISIGPTNILFTANSTPNTHNILKGRRLTDTKIGMTYDSSPELKGRSIILEINGTIVTPKTSMIFSEARPIEAEILPLASEKMFLYYKNTANSYLGILNIASGDTISLSAVNTAANIVSDFSSYQDIRKLTSTKSILAFEKANDKSVYGTIISHDVNSQILTSSSPVTLATITASVTNVPNFTTAKYAMLGTNFDEESNKKVIFVYGSSYPNFKHPIFSKLLTVTPTNQISVGSASENPIYDHVVANNKIAISPLDENNCVVIGTTEKTNNFPSIPFVSFIDASQSVPVKKAIRSVNQNDISALTSNSSKFLTIRLSSDSFLGLNQGFLSDGSFVKLFYYKKPQS